MKIVSIVYKIGCWSFILVGFGHIVTSMLMPDTLESAKIIQDMQDFSISMSGTETNLYNFYEGFSLMMGILLIGYGLLNLVLIKIPTFPIRHVTNINIAVSLIALIIAIKYLFIVPVALLFVAFICFSVVLVLSIKSTKLA